MTEKRPENASPDASGKEPEPFRMGRRDFMRFVSSLMVAGSAPDAVAKLAAGQSPYPWISDARVLDAMLELDKISEISADHVEFKMPHMLDKYVLGYGAPEVQPLGEKRKLYADSFWQELKGTPSKDSIRNALKKAESVLQAERAIEPRRQKLVTRIRELTGEDPWLLRIEPKMAGVLKRLIAEHEYNVIPTENMMSYLEEGVGTLQRYWRAYNSGTLEKFTSDEFQRIHHRGYEYEGNGFTRKPRQPLKGEDYVPSRQETDSALNALKHFLNIPSTQIDSTAELPTSYTVMIHNRKDVRSHIRHLAKEIFGREEGARFMQINENSHPLKDMPWAHGRPGTPGYLTISDPPYELRQIIEEARQKKEQSRLTQR